MKTRIKESISINSLRYKFACFLRGNASWKKRASIVTLLWFVTCAVALAQGTADTAYVTLVHPDGTRAFYSLPASPTACDRGAKLQQAKAAALPGDTIIVGPGEASTNTLLKDGVNWHFEAGATVIGDCCSGQTGCTLAGGIFKDNGTTVNCIISGAGYFVSNHIGGVVNVSATSSNVSITADSLSGTFVVLQSHGTLHVKANTITSEVGASYATVWWTGGSLHVEAHEIITPSGTAVQSYAPFGTSTGEYLWIQANLIESTSPLPNVSTIAFNDAEPSTRHWIQALQIQGPIAIKKASPVPGSGHAGGLTYIRAEKIFGQIVQLTDSGILYVDAEKVSPPDPSVSGYLNANLIKLSGTSTNSWINISQIDDTNIASPNYSPAPAVVAVTAGTHYLRGSSLDRLNVGHGISVSGGMLTVNGLAVSTSSGSKDLVQSGTGLLKVLDCGYSLLKTSGTITEGNPKTGILGTAAFEASSATPIETYGIYSGIITSAKALAKGQYQVFFGRSEPDTNYMVSAIAESYTGRGTVCFWSNKSTDGFVLNLVDLSSGDFADQDGVRVTVSRIP